MSGNLVEAVLKVRLLKIEVNISLDFSHAIMNIV